MFLVLPCVTINRPGPDTELLVGQYGIDWTQDSAEIKYSGLGDNPAAYRVRYAGAAGVSAWSASSTAEPHKRPAAASDSPKGL